MAHNVAQYELVSSGITAISMPKRARVLAVGCTAQGKPILMASVENNADTRAFDTGQHQRHFDVIGVGDEIPADGQLVGMATHHKPAKPTQFLLVYEVPGIRGPR